jgi:hypothetical protein
VEQAPPATGINNSTAPLIADLGTLMKKLSDYDPILEFDKNKYCTPTARCIIFWIFYTGLHIGLFAFGYIKQRDDPSLEVLNQIGVSISISRGAGLVLAFDCVILM